MIMINEHILNKRMRSLIFTNIADRIGCSIRIPWTGWLVDVVYSTEAIWTVSRINCSIEIERRTLYDRGSLRSCLAV